MTPGGSEWWGEKPSLSPPGNSPDTLKIEGEGELQDGEDSDSYTFTEWFAPGFGLVKGNWVSESEILEFELKRFSVGGNP